MEWNGEREREILFVIQRKSMHQLLLISLHLDEEERGWEWTSVHPNTKERKRNKAVKMINQGNAKFTMKLLKEMFSFYLEWSFSGNAKKNKKFFDLETEPKKIVCLFDHQSKEEEILLNLLWNFRL